LLIKKDVVRENKLSPQIYNHKIWREP